MLLLNVDLWCCANYNSMNGLVPSLHTIEAAFKTGKTWHQNAIANTRAFWCGGEHAPHAVHTFKCLHGLSFLVSTQVSENSKSSAYLAADVLSEHQRNHRRRPGSGGFQSQECQPGRPAQPAPGCCCWGGCMPCCPHRAHSTPPAECSAAAWLGTCAHMGLQGTGWPALFEIANA